MSRIGKKPIEIPDGVEVEIKANVVRVKGPKGELVQEIPGEISVEKKDNKIFLKVKKETKNSSALWGLFRALLKNDAIGVKQGFQKQMEIQGVGYRASVSGNNLKLELGFSHPIELKIPEGLEVKVEKNIIAVSGASKQKVGQFSANIRKNKPPEPYKGKGIRYVGEKVRRKEGKKAGSVTA